MYTRAAVIQQITVQETRKDITDRDIKLYNNLLFFPIHFHVYISCDNCFIKNFKFSVSSIICVLQIYQNICMTMWKQNVNKRI